MVVAGESEPVSDLPEEELADTPRGPVEDDEGPPRRDAVPAPPGEGNLRPTLLPRPKRKTYRYSVVWRFPFIVQLCGDRKLARASGCLEKQAEHYPERTFDEYMLEKKPNEEP